jgi:uncharacterized C2H2 Zn-finger protein
LPTKLIQKIDPQAENPILDQEPSAAVPCRSSRTLFSCSACSRHFNFSFALEKHTKKCVASQCGNDRQENGPGKEPLDLETAFEPTAAETPRPKRKAGVVAHEVNFKVKIEECCSGDRQCGDCGNATDGRGGLAKLGTTSHKNAPEVDPDADGDVPAASSKRESTAWGRDLYQCHLCDAQLKYYQSVLRHLASVHYGDDLKEFCVGSTECRQCGKQFSKRSMLLRHVMAKHKIFFEKLPSEAQLRVVKEAAGKAS